MSTVPVTFLSRDVTKGLFSVLFGKNCRRGSFMGFQNLHEKLNELGELFTGLFYSRITSGWLYFARPSVCNKYCFKNSNVRVMV
jgi:hypothetical protein